MLDGLALAGMRAFGVASPEEMDLVRAHLPGAVLNYRDPVR